MKHDRHFIHPNASISCFLIMSDNELSLQVKTSYTIKFKIVIKKISSLLVVLLLMLASFTAGVEYERGDTNHDGVVNIADVTCLIDYLLNGTWPDDPVTPPDDHEWVDLGLPSGTLWATCNVGANSPEEYGDYFAWGETESKNYYGFSTYKWCNGSVKTMTKYCIQTDYGYNGFTDGKTELDPEDDAAYVNWGTSWRMPTVDQQQELVDNCTWTWTTQNDVNGSLVVGPNGNSLFLPAASCYAGDRVWSIGRAGDYWSRSLTSDYSCSAHELVVYSSDSFGISFHTQMLNRDYGLTVRAVRVP